MTSRRNTTTSENSTTQVETVTEPSATPAQGRVYVYDTETGNKLPNPVPRSWLDGRFPNLKEQPSKKAGN